MLPILDCEASFGANPDGLFIKREQVITDDFLSDLASERLAKQHVRAAEMDRVASVPTFVVELWQRQGADIHQMSAREIVARLRRDNLEAFIATPKRV